MPAARLNGDTFIQLEVHCCEELPRNTDEATTAEGGRGGHATEPARLRGGRAPCAMIGRKTGAPVGEGSARSERGVQRHAGRLPGLTATSFLPLISAGRRREAARRLSARPAGGRRAVRAVRAATPARPVIGRGEGGDRAEACRVGRWHGGLERKGLGGCRLALSRLVLPCVRRVTCAV